MQRKDAPGATDRPISFKPPPSGKTRTPPPSVTGEEGPRRGLRGGLDRRAAAPRVPREPCPNARVVPQRLCPVDDTEATTDPADMAHAVFSPRGGLLPAREVDGRLKRPRRYHASGMVGPPGQRVSAETAIERCEAARARLRAELGDVDGITCGESLSAVTAAEMMRRMR